MRPLSRRSLLGLMAAGTAAATPWSAIARSPQCQGVPPAAKTLEPLKGPTLGEAAARKGIAFGIQASVLGNPQDYGPGIYDPLYMQLIEREKPAFIAYGGAFNFGNAVPDQPDPSGEMAFANRRWNIADSLYMPREMMARLRPKGIRARADSLVWDDHQVLQPWLRKIPRGASPDRRKNRDLDWNLSQMEAFIGEVIPRMAEIASDDPAPFQSICVVNEPLDPFDRAPKCAYRGGVFAPQGIALDEIGHTMDYIAAAFRATSAALDRIARISGRPRWTAPLMINETSAETDQFGPIVRPALVSLIKTMKADGLQVGALGLECHLQPQMMTNPEKPDWCAFVGFLDEIAALGVEIHLTELDVFDWIGSCNGRPGTVEENDRLVARYVESFLDAALSNKAVKAVTAWDLADRTSFYRAIDVSTWYGYDHLDPARDPDAYPKCPQPPKSPDRISCPRPVLYDDRYRAKPARAAMLRAFDKAPTRG